MHGAGTKAPWCDMTTQPTPAQLAVALDSLLRRSRHLSGITGRSEPAMVEQRRELEWALDDAGYCNRCFAELDPAGRCPDGACRGPLRLVPDPSGGPNYVAAGRDRSPLP